MQKRLLCAVLALMMLVCGISVTVLAEEAQVLHTVNLPHFVNTLTEIGEEATSTFQYENEDIQDNNEISRAEYFPKDKTILVGDVGYTNAATNFFDPCDFYKITLDHNCHLSFAGVSGTDGLNSTGFELLDSNGELLCTADYEGETNTDDYYSFEITLSEGTYYICVTDTENWASYYFAFILTPALETPVFTGISVEPDTGKPVLTWNAVNGAGSYEIHRGESGDDFYEQLSIAEGTTFTDTTAGAGVVYDYKLIAVSGDETKKNSPYSDKVSVVCALAKPVAAIANDADTGKPVVSWEAVEGAEGYEIYRSLEEDGDYEPAGTVTDGGDFQDMTAWVGTEYFYKVRAFHSNEDANSVLSEAVSIVCRLGKPVVTTAYNDSGKPVLEWESVEGAEKYRIYRSTSATKGFEAVGNTVAATKYTDKNAATGKTYYYKVRAIYEDFTADSEVVSRMSILAKPTVTITGDSATGRNVLKWGAVTGASKYEIYRAVAEDGDYVPVGPATSSRSYTDEDTAAGIAYYYKVKAIYKNEAANSENSYVVSRVCALEKPAVEITNSDSGKPVITWEIQTGASAYEIYRTDSKSGTYEPVSRVEGEAAYTDETAEQGKTYYYKVKALHEVESANSEDSDAVSIICTLPRAVVRITGDSATGKNVVEWETVEGAETYRVYRSTSENKGYSAVYTGSTAGSYTDKSGSAGTTYYYKVRAVCDDYSSDSEVVSRVCALPKPTATIGLDSVTGKPIVKWKTVTGASRYDIYRAAAADGAYEQIGSATSARSFADETAEAGITYYYSIQAIHKKDNADSEYAEAVRCQCTLAKPAVTIASSDSGKPVITWKIQTGASAYEISRADSKSGTYEPVYTAVGEDSYTDEMAELGKTYCYKVKAVHEVEAANSEDSDAVSIICTLPRAVVRITGDSATGKNVVEWETVEGAETYRVYRSTSENKGYSAVYTSSTAGSYTDKSGSAGTTYYYKVRAVCDDYSSDSEVVSRVCALPKPTATIGLDSDSGKPIVKWKTVTGASRYDIYRAAAADSAYEQVGSATSARSFTDETAEAGITYYYSVQAIHKKDNADSEYAEAVRCLCTLAKPVLTTSRTAEGKPVISWKLQNEAAGYEIYRSTTKSSGYELADTVVSEDNYTDETAEAGITYYYKVKAIHEDPAADSVESAVVSRVCSLPSPEVGIDINSDTGNPIVQWETVEGAAKYYVYRSTSESKGYEKVYTATTARSYTDKNAKAGTTYYYKVKAIHENASAGSEYSEVVSCICAPAMPEVSSSVNTSTGKPVVKWKTVTGASEYQVYRATEAYGAYEKVYTAVSARSYTDQKAEAGRYYYYMVKAIHKGTGTESEYSEVLTQICALEKPMVSITRLEGNPSLSWEEISGAVKYQVYRATSKTGAYTQVGTVTEGSFTDTEAKAGKTYYYKVMAIHENPEANSEFSTVKYITAK